MAADIQEDEFGSTPQSDTPERQELPKSFQNAGTVSSLFCNLSCTKYSFS